MFVEMKGFVCDFVTKIVNEEWKSDFMFAIDIMEKLNELNVKPSLCRYWAQIIYEQAFSCMKINKSKNRSMLTDCNLNAIIRITTSTVNWFRSSRTLSEIVHNYILLINYNYTLWSACM